MSKEEFIGKLQMCYFGDRNAFNEIVSAYNELKEENIELRADYGTKTQIERDLLKEKIDRAINYIDQVIMYKPGAKELDKELNELIGILGGKNER